MGADEKTFFGAKKNFKVFHNSVSIIHNTYALTCMHELLFLLLGFHGKANHDQYQNSQAHTSLTKRAQDKLQLKGDWDSLTPGRLLAANL